MIGYLWQSKTSEYPRWQVSHHARPLLSARLDATGSLLPTILSLGFFFCAAKLVNGLS